MALADGRHQEDFRPGLLIAREKAEQRQTLTRSAQPDIKLSFFANGLARIAKLLSNLKKVILHKV